MTYTGNVGDTSIDASQIVSLYVYPGTTINVANVAASTGTISYYNNGLDQGASGTIAAGSNQNFSAPAFLTSSGISTIQIIGTGY